MSEVDVQELENQRSRNEGQQSDIQDDIDDIDERIDALKAAYKILDDEKEKARDYKKIVNGMPGVYSDMWRGEKANQVYDTCENDGALSNTYKEYIDAIDSIEDSINDEITRLKNSRSDKWGILQGLIEAWRNLTNRIHNAVN